MEKANFEYGFEDKEDIQSNGGKDVKVEEKDDDIILGDRQRRCIKYFYSVKIYFRYWILSFW